MIDFPPNVQVSQRMQVVDISDVELHGVLAATTDYDDLCDRWMLTDGKYVANLTEWLDAFEGKEVVITIALANPRDDGVMLRKKKVETA